MRIGGLIKFSLIDYPQKVAATIFTQGCNYRCPYCHNADLVLPENFKELIPEDEILDFLNKRKDKLKAVVITGGEPTLHHDLPEFLRKIKELGYSVKLDTNGSNPEMLKILFEQKLVDYIAMDVKAPFEKYDLLTGISADVSVVKESIDLITKSGIEHEFRTTVIKSLLSYDDIQKMYALVPKTSLYKLQEFVPRENALSQDYSKDQKDHYPKEELKQIQDSLINNKVC